MRWIATGRGMLAIYESRDECNALTRAECFAWLWHCDPNGSYSDAEQIGSGHSPLSIDELRDCVWQLCHDA